MIVSILYLSYSSNMSKIASKPDNTNEAKGRKFRIRYTNYRGESAEREIIFEYFWWGKTEWHPKEQFLIHAIDTAKDEPRDFALADIDAWLE